MGPQWSEDRVWKEKTGRRKVEMKRRGLKMALGKIKTRGLYCLPPVRIVVLFLILIVIFFFVI